MATQANVNVQTVRFYEREGLLRKPARTPGGYRTYEQRDLDRVMFIRVCQGLGFTLHEVRQLIRLHRITASADHGSAMSAESMREILSIAQERIQSIEEKIAALSRMRSEMEGVVRALSSTAPARCPASAPQTITKTALPPRPENSC